MQSRNNKKNIAVNKITTSIPYQVATQVGRWMINHPSEVYVSAIGLCCAYKLIRGEFNGDEQSLNQLSNEPQFYSWFSASTHFSTNMLNSYANIIAHGFPITKSMFNQIGLGVAIGVLQFPMYCYLSLFERNLRYAAAGSQPSLFDKDCLTPIHEEGLFRGLVLPVCWAYLTKLGVPSTYAITGAVIINSALFAYAHKPGDQLFTSAFGLFSSGYTLGQDGSLWTSVAAHATHNMLVTVVTEQCREDDAAARTSKRRLG